MTVMKNIHRAKRAVTSVLKYRLLMHIVLFILVVAGCSDGFTLLHEEGAHFGTDDGNTEEML